ncbi:MAG: hypothetical protein RI560_08665 [Natronomonas sp.]|nr:hypothetical protein [Natronomonas sp.]
MNLERLHRLVERLVGGQSIFERGDWDICCVLDGCRVDALAAEREYYSGELNATVENGTVSLHELPK